MNCSADTIQDFIGIPESTINEIFNKFVKNYSEQCFKKYVNLNSETINDDNLKKLHFVLFNKQGLRTVYEGGFLIIVGGYLKLTCLMDPIYNSWPFNEVLWSEWIESIRKDVECTIGILKKRFNFLKDYVQ
jgi:hypothetical protein